VSKFAELNSERYVSDLLRRELIYSMLDVIENYPFCSIANQQAILILDILKKSINEEELEYLKNFIERNLSSEDKIKIRFDSGYSCNSSNLATLIKMGLALKELTANL
jgi:hypothetical protein